MDPPEIPIPEVPALAEAAIVQHPTSGRDCLLATTERGERIAFGFETESDAPGLELVDPKLWLEAPADESELAFEAVEEAQADDWLQAVTSNAVGAEWLGRIKDEHPDAYRKWFAQAEYEEGGEEGSG